MKYIYNVIVGLCAIVALNSCNHDDETKYVGPAICPPENFAITSPLSVSNPNVNLSLEADTIRAGFSHPFSWTLTLTGNTSGARRVYTGYSDTVGVVWKGQPGSPIMFVTEKVTATLSIPCREDVKIEFDITPNNFATYGVIISDFDGQGQVSNTPAATFPGYSATGWSTYFSAPNALTELTIGPGPLVAPQGSNYLTVKGTAGPKSWFAGGMYHNISLSSLPTSDPTQIYFNAFVNSGSNKTTILGITFRAAGVKYTKTVLINWTGWKLVTFKLSDFLNSSDQYVANAFTLADADWGLNCASAKGQSMEVNLDLIMFTAYEPLY